MITRVQAAHFGQLSKVSIQRTAAAAASKSPRPQIPRPSCPRIGELASSRAENALNLKKLQTQLQLVCSSCSKDCVYELFWSRVPYMSFGAASLT